MALGKQAKILTDKQVRAVLAELDTGRYPLRDRVMFLLSIKAGLRAKEVASVTWGMLTDAEDLSFDVPRHSRDGCSRSAVLHAPLLLRKLSPRGRSLPARLPHSTRVTREPAHR